ncbi:beta-glycosidase [Bacteroidales bacterium]|nr:beta-glycosidase [Bacteroidales bacterium]
MKQFLLIISVTLLSVSCRQPKVNLVSTTPEDKWTVTENIEYGSDSKSADVVIDRTKTAQTIEGFGACFNELGWDALSVLSSEDKHDIFNELFTPEVGANFKVCRMPVAANDFSLDWYSYNETDGDFDMENFSIENDTKTLIPYIHEAQKYNPDLKIWGSPWCPPSWMKYNNHYACAVSGDHLDEVYRNDLTEEQRGAEGTNMFIQEEDYFKAYALYFKKYIEAYREHNINVAMVMPQNEWNSCQVFPSCTWTAAGLNEFIGKYLGPEMDKLGVELMLGTMERPNDKMVDTIMQDEASSKYVTGVGFQWAGKEALPNVYKNYPDVKLYQTEQECGDGKNDWKHCNHSWELMKHYLSHGVNTYLYWNMALQEGGISRWGWSQNSLVTVNKNDKTYRYNYEYYLLKHVSHFVKPGAKRIITDGAFEDLLVFENVDKSIVVIARNMDKEAKPVTIDIDGKSLTITLKSDSFSTIVIPS